MNKRQFNSLVILFALFLPVASWSQEVTLEQAYSSALKIEDHSEKNQAIKEQARARFKQARSYVFPSITAVGKYTDSRTRNLDTDTETTSLDRTVGVNLRQPLFQGGLFSGMQRESAAEDISNLTVKKNDLDLYALVAEAYYRINLLSSTLEVLNEIDAVSSKRVKDLKRRVSIGKSKQTDFLTNELQNQDIKLQIGQVSTDLKAMQDLFARLTGLPATSKPKVDNELPVVKPLDYYLGRINQTPDLQIQSKNLYIAEKNKSIETSQHLPNLYFDLSARQGEFGVYEEGREVAAGLTLELPLFLGGRTSAKAQEADWKRREEKAKLQSLTKDYTVDIKNQYSLLTKNVELFKLYEESLVTARKNYQVFNRELGLGLVSNLELLESLRSYLDAKKNREAAFVQLKLIELNLNKLVGEKK